MDRIPVAEMNTSMTINATAAWLLGLYVAHAEDRGVDPALLSGTTQNDIVKEYLSRGTYIFPPGPSLRLTVDTIAYTVRHAPKWNPINVCSYHLQEAGATPVQEVAYALATAIGVLDGVRASGKIDPSELPAVVGRISFFVNSGVRFVEETCKMRAFTAMWDRICAERYGVEDPKLRRFRYGVQVNSLGLTEQQPENNVPRIVLESLGVTLSKSARARAMQLPAWNEALGLPRPWDQQWSLRMQQILAFESDLLEYGDIFEGSKVIEAKTGRAHGGGRRRAGRRRGPGRRLRGHRRAEDAARAQPGRAGAPHRDRGAAGGRRQLLHRDRAFAAHRRRRDREHPEGGPRVEAELMADVERWRAGRDQAAVGRALDQLRRVAEDDGPGGNIMEATIALAHAGGTTGEWAGALREVFGEFRAPTGVGGGVGRRGEELAPDPGPHPGPGRADGRAAAAPGGQARAWTATPTARSRSPWRPATPDSRSSTRASGSRRRRSWPPPATRTSTSSAFPSSRAPTWSWCPTCWTASAPPGWTPPWWWAGSSRPTTPRSCWARAWPRCTRRRTTPSTASWRIWSRWPSASAPPFPGEPGHLAPGDRHRPELDGPQAEALGQVVVVQGGGAAVALVAAWGDAEARRQCVQLGRIVRQQVGPAVLALADGGPLAPVVDVDGQGRAQGRSRRSGIGLFHQRPLNRQVWCTGSCSSGAPGCGHTSWAAAVMAARTSGPGSGRGAGRAAGSRRGIVSTGTASERHVAVLAAGELLALGGQDLQAAADDGPGVGRRDDVVDVAPLRRDVGVGVALGVLVDQLGPPAAPGRPPRPARGGRRSRRRRWGPSRPARPTARRRPGRRRWTWSS